MAERYSREPRPEDRSFRSVYDLLAPLRSHYMAYDYRAGLGGYVNGKKPVYFRHGDVDFNNNGDIVGREDGYQREQSYDPHVEGPYIDRCNILLNKMANGIPANPETMRLPTLETRIVGAYVHNKDLHASFRQASLTGIKMLLTDFGNLFPTLTPALHALIRMGGAGGMRLVLVETGQALKDASAGTFTWAGFDDYKRLQDTRFETPLTFPLTHRAYKEIKCAAPQLGDSMMDQVKRAALDIAFLLKRDPTVFPFQRKIKAVDVDEARNQIRAHTDSLLASAVIEQYSS